MRPHTGCSNQLLLVVAGVSLALMSLAEGRRHTTPARPIGPVILNVDMTRGAEIPSGWTAASSDGELARDTRVFKGGPGKPAAAGDRFTAGPPPKDKPWVPGWGFYPSHPGAWQEGHRYLLDRTKKGGIKVLFLGDSIIEGWSDTSGARMIWDRNYAPAGAANYGVGGDSTRQVLWRLQNGEINGLSPRLVVLMIGTNNLYADHNAGTDNEVARGIAAIVRLLRAKLPQTHVLLLGILPRASACSIPDINRLIAPLDNGKAVRFLDMSPKFQQPGGDLIRDLYYPDQVHLRPRGYRVWCETMQPLFDEMMR